MGKASGGTKSISWRDKPISDQEKRNYIMDLMNVGRSEAIDIVEHLSYIEQAFEGTLKRYFEGRDNAALDDLNRFIDASPRYEGNLYRGIALTDDGLSNLLQKAESGELERVGISWSTSLKVAKDFSQRPATESYQESTRIFGSNRVIFETTGKGHKAATTENIARFGKREQEAFMHTKEKFKVESVRRDKNGITYIKLR